MSQPTTRFQISGLRRVVCAVLACGMISAACGLARAQTVTTSQAAAGQEKQQPWEYSPYRVQVWLAFAPSPEFTDQVQASLAESLGARIDSLIGAPWRCQVLPPPEAFQGVLAVDGNLLTPESLFAAHPDALKLDKIIVVDVHSDGRGYSLAARELDCRTRGYGPTVHQRVRQPAYLELACFRALADAFRPVTRIEEGEPKSAVVRVRAGGLVLDRDSPCYIGADDILLPILRNNERDGTFRSAARIDWTFLEVESPGAQNPNLLTCRVWSGRPNPIQGRVSSRKEQYALKVRPADGTTLLRVAARENRATEPYPMPGLEVYAKIPEEPAPQPTATAAPAEEAVDEAGGESSEESAEEALPRETPSAPSPQPPPARESQPPVLVGHTDWRGAIEIGPGESLLRLVYLKNGGQLLARLPIVPGLDRELIAEVPDDSPRLAAEGFVKGLQSQVMDLEAQRKILEARIRLRIEEGKPREASALLEELKQLPTRNDLIRQLDQQQNQQVVSPNPRVQNRIDRLYGETRELLSKYLAPSLLNDLIGEINRANAAASAQTDAAGEATAGASSEE